MNDTATLNSSVPLMTLQTAISAVNLGLGFPIKSYVLWLMLRGAAGGTIASEFFPLNLTVSEAIFSLAAVAHIAWISTRVSFLKRVLYFSIGFMLYSIPSFQCCVCVERYVAVIHPVVFLRYKPLRYRVACGCAVWLMVLALSFGNTFDVSSMASHHILLGFYVVLVSVMSFCCLSVLRALRRPGPGEGQGDSSGVMTNMKRRAFTIILISLIVMLMTYLPYVLATPLQHYFSPGTFRLVICIIHAIVVMSGFVHPLLYLHRAGKMPCIKGF